MTTFYADPADMLGPSLTVTPLADHYRAVVVADRIGRFNEAVGWFVHGDDRQATHAMNDMSDEELALAAVVCERVASLAAEILGVRRALGDEIGALVVGAGRRRAL